MYSVVLAAMLTAGAETPNWHWGSHGCHGCWGCHGCSGYNAFSGCWGCRGCHGCHGCYGSCYNGSGCYCYGCYGSCFGCYGSCYGCYGQGVVGVMTAAPGYRPAVAKAPGGGGDPATTPMSEAEKAAVREILQKMREMKKGSLDSTPAPAQVTVNAPDGARLYVDGVLCAVRTFQTPSLQPGREYYYDLRVEMAREGQAQTQSRRVSVAAGRQVTVDFSLARMSDVAQR
jgi:uncharacterized protein (TIGR03000 family)